MEEPSEEVDAARLSDEDAVALLTVHKAKGLEWPVVFVPAIYQQNFPSQAVGGYDNPYQKAETLPWEWRIDPPPHDPVTAEMDAGTLTNVLRRNREEVKAAHQSQEWRVAYVASTRAKQELVLSGAHWYGYPEPSLKPKLPRASDFFKRAWLATRKTPPDQDVDQELERAYPAPARPESFATPTQALYAPDPVFGEEGWPEGIRRVLLDPDWIVGIAHGEQVEEEYQASLEEFSGLLFRLPDPTPETRPEALSTSATGLVTYAQCPKKYFWTAVDPLPRRYSYVTRSGNPDPSPDRAAPPRQSPPVGTRLRTFRTHRRRSSGRLSDRTGPVPGLPRLPLFGDEDPVAGKGVHPRGGRELHSEGPDRRRIPNRYRWLGSRRLQIRPATFR